MGGWDVVCHLLWAAVVLRLGAKLAAASRERGWWHRHAMAVQAELNQAVFEARLYRQRSDSLQAAVRRRARADGVEDVDLLVALNELADARPANKEAVGAAP